MRAVFLALIMAVTAIIPARAEVAPSMKNALDQQVQQLKTALHGKRIGFLTNPTAVDAKFRHLADVLAEDAGTTITAFFAPEHGIRGDVQAGGGVQDYVDPHTGIPVYSLYGSNKAPSAQQLENVDVVLYDIQDVGSRFYTFVWTMTHAMEAAAANNKEFVVFDRPNPAGANRVEGAPNPTDNGLIGRKWPDAPWGVATRHGLTAGELATLVNAEWMNPKVKLTVIKVPGYTRDMTFEETGYPWVFPSPNMPTLDTARVYPGMCLFEGASVSEGRGTTRPFELMGAPYIDAHAFAAALNAKNLPGMRFRQSSFQPSFDNHSGEFCNGIQVHMTDADTFEPIPVALQTLKTLLEMYPEQVTLNSNGWCSKLMGVPNLETRIKNEEVSAIVAGWQTDLNAYKQMRAKHLLYPESNGTGWQAK